MSTWNFLLRSGISHAFVRMCAHVCICMLKQNFFDILAGQPGVARAFAIRAEVCRFASLAPLSFLASRSINPEVNTLPYGENLLFIELA